MISLEDQIKAVGLLLDDLRWARSKPDVPEHATFNALKQIAADLTARLPGQPGKVRKAIGMRVADAVRSKTALGYDENHLVGIGENVIGEWPAIEYALEAVERMHCGDTDVHADRVMSEIWAEWFRFYQAHFRGGGIAISSADQMAFYEIAQPALRKLAKRQA